MAEPAAEPPIFNLVGQQVALGPPSRDLLALFQRWLNDFEVTRTLQVGPRPLTLEQEAAWYDRPLQPGQDVQFMIWELAVPRPIGMTGLHQIDHAHGTAEFGIMIGEKTCWGRGYGTEATRLMLDYAFHGLGLHNVLLRAYAYNERGLGAYRRAGFREIGRRREAQRLGQRRYDVVYMDCLAGDVDSQQVRQLLDPPG